MKIYIHLQGRSNLLCMLHGLTRPSMPQSSELRRVQEYDAHQDSTSQKKESQHQSREHALFQRPASLRQLRNNNAIGINASLVESDTEERNRACTRSIESTDLPLSTRTEKEKKRESSTQLNKSLEQGLNLSGSQQQGYSTTYSTPILFKSSAKDSPPRI